MINSELLPEYVLLLKVGCQDQADLAATVQTVEYRSVIIFSLWYFTSRSHSVKQSPTMLESQIPYFAQEGYAHEIAGQENGRIRTFIVQS